MFTGFVDVEAGTIQLQQHGRDQCTTELVGHWTGGLPDCLFFCDPVLIAPN